jgi:hypothetical protein
MTDRRSFFLVACLVLVAFVTTASAQTWSPEQQEIYPIAITITGNVAVVQYRYLSVSENHKKDRETVTGRYTDVRIKEAGRWLFIAWAGGDDPKK